MVELTPSNPTLVTPVLYLAVVLRLQFMLFKVTEDTKYLDNMIEAIQSAVPDTRPAGVKAFLAFDDEAYSNGLGEEEIEQIKDELKVTNQGYNDNMCFETNMQIRRQYQPCQTLILLSSKMFAAL